MMSRETARSSIHAGGRRRFPRIQLDGVLEAFDTTTGVAVPINDVSYGGLQTLSPSPVLPLTEHHFRVTVRRGTVHKLRAQVVYCRPRADNQLPYVVGWRLGSDFETATSITALIDYLTNAASFDGDTPVLDGHLNLRVTIGAESREWRLHHIDSRTLSVIGCRVPEGHVAHVSVRLSHILGVTLRARAHAPDASLDRQLFSFVNPEPELLELVLTAAPAVLVN